VLGTRKFDAVMFKLFSGMMTKQFSGKHHCSEHHQVFFSSTNQLQLLTTAIAPGHSNSDVRSLALRLFRVADLVTRECFRTSRNDHYIWTPQGLPPIESVVV
jgi:hypothetical protein